MKRMKKILALLLVLVMVTALTACGDKDDDTAKKGKSRDTKNTSQQKDPDDDTVTTTPTAEPTNEPTDDPTPTPTAEPTPEPTADPTPTPTPTDEPKPAGKELTYETLAGKWKMETAISGSQYGAMISDELEELFKSLEASKPNSMIKISLQIEFRTDKTATASAQIDGTEFAEAVKAMTATEDGILAFYSAMTGMDIETLKGYLSMTGMSAADLLESMNFDDFFEEMRSTEVDDVTYEIKGNTIYMDEDEEVVLVYNSAKDTLEFEINTDDEEAFIYKGKYLTRIN